MINFHKYHIDNLGSSPDSVHRAADILHCVIGSFLFSYLRLPIKVMALLREEREDWQPLLDRIDRRLASWKGAFLSRVGRLILITAVLSSVPLYYTSFYHLPEWVIQAIDKVRPAFLWKGASDIMGGLCLGALEHCL